MQSTYLAIFQCLISIMQCQGWRIYTIEGITPSFPALNPIQDRLVKFNGTQCGFCSSGMIMNMYALYQNDKLTMQEVENSFSGNICRCTGYRPILSAFKSLCKDVDYNLIGHCSDVSDIEDIKPCPKPICQKQCQDQEARKKEPILHLFGDDVKWIIVFSIQDLLSTINKYQDQHYMLVGGNTAKGVKKSYGEGVQVYIEITSVPELVGNQIKGDKFILGASNTLANTIEIFNKIGQENQQFSYLKKMASHIGLIANVPVRNIGTLAGNLMIKHDYNEFPSDIFLILETAGAVITIVSTNGVEDKMHPRDFYKSDMKKKVIKEISFPSLAPNSIYESFKIILRSQNVHAIVNAGFLFNFKSDRNTLNSATVVYGNINPSFVHAANAEKLLSGKKLFDNGNLQQVYAALDKEVKADFNPPDPGPKYRHQLAIALFYKAVLNIAPADKISAQNKTGALLVENIRPLSNGVQDFTTNKSMYPVSEPISKIEAKAQCDGQAKYIMDLPKLPHQLYGAFILAKARAGSTIKKIDPSNALKQKDIVAFFSHTDIPGQNNFNAEKLSQTPEEIFCSGKISFFDQPVGLLVANSTDALDKAVDLVQIEYEISKNKPLLTVRDILQANATDRLKKVKNVVAKRKGTEIQHVIKGTFDIYQQYHFHMETQICAAIPTENGLDIYASTQWLAYNQQAIGQMLNIPYNNVTVHVRRCGGSFGSKINRNSLISCAAALAAYKLRRPVSMMLSLETNMRVIGKRFPFSANYEAGVNDEGVLQYINADLYTDMGSRSNFSIVSFVKAAIDANYNPDIISFRIYEANTDCSSNTLARAPGTNEGFGFIESLMAHIATEINVDQFSIRAANIPKDNQLSKFVKDLLDWADINHRKDEINNFNQANRWQKKGIAPAIMAYEIKVDNTHSVLVSIFATDGSVAVTHGGVEIGQGINTKVAQVCAYKLGIPVERVKIVPTTNTVTPNGNLTGNSFTSEAISYCVLQACDKLLKRMRPFRDEDPDLPWEKLVLKCYHNNVQLNALGFCDPVSPGIEKYDVYGAAACEVLVDVLTGQFLITRVDLIEDTGQSMNPKIDMGQVEGAFIMGMGYQTTEQMVYNADTGEVLSDSTWTYYPPLAKDIPVDMRIKFPPGGNPVGILKSKATGEPAVALSISVPLAIRNALASARHDANPNADAWFAIDCNTNTETVFMNSMNDFKQYTL